MILRVDKEHDIVRILFTRSPIEHTDERAEGMICDYDADGNVVGVEFLNAARIFGDLGQLERKSKHGVGSIRRSIGPQTAAYEACPT